MGNINIILDPLTISFLKEGKIYLQQDAKTNVYLTTLGPVGIAGGTIKCTSTQIFILTQWH